MLVKFITGNQVLLGKAFSISIPLLNLVIMGKQIKNEKKERKERKKETGK